MISIISYIKLDDIDNRYRLNGLIDGLPYIYYVSADMVEISGIWDEAKALTHVGTQEVNILESARLANIHIIDKNLEVTGTLEASDIIVATPNIPPTLADKRQAVKDEIIKDRKSIALLAIAQASLIEDLIKRVETLEKIK